MIFKMLKIMYMQSSVLILKLLIFLGLGILLIVLSKVKQ